MWLLLNYMLMKGTLLHGYENGQTYSDRLYFVASLTFMLVGAGRAWGLDGALRPTLARIPVIRWLAGVDHADAEEPGRSEDATTAWSGPSRVVPLPHQEAHAQRDRRAA
jgi:hypothetical protein